MWYLIALQTSLPPQKDLTFKNIFDGSTIVYGKTPPPLMGVRYNVIRRPLSGGKGSIRKHQPTKSNPQGESDADFYARLQGIIREDPASFFMRWTSEVSPQDVEKFREQFLNPVLDNLLDDYEWWEWCLLRGWDHYDYDERARTFSDHRRRHFRLPYGIYSPLLDGRPSDLDSYLDDGSLGSLKRADGLFRELSDG
jgi:hypothetical protein